MSKRAKDNAGEVTYTSELGKSLVTNLVLGTLVDEGKLESLEKVRATGKETTLAPRPDEAVVFVAFFDADLRLPCAALVKDVLRLRTRND